MTLRVFAGASLAFALCACATATTGTAPLPMPRDLAGGAHVNVVRMTSGWVEGNAEFTETFTESVHENLRRCAGGPRPLDLSIHIDRVNKADRLGALLRGGAEHRISAIAEFVDPATRAVVGRYPIDLMVDAGGPVAIVLADRQLMVSDAFATELCRQAFGA